MKLSALHITRLTAELMLQVTGARITGLHKSEAEKTILIQIIRDDEKNMIVYQFGINRSYLFLRSGHPVKISTTNFLPQLLGGSIVAISQVGFDRIMRLEIETSEQIYQIIFELFGQNGNLLLFDSTAGLITSLRKSKTPDANYHPPESINLENPLEFDLVRVAGLLVDESEDHLAVRLAKTFAGLSLETVQEFLKSKGILREARISEFSTEQLEKLLSRLREDCWQFVDPASQICYDLDPPVICISSVEDLKKSTTISEIFQVLATQPIVIPKEKTLKARLERILRSALKKESRKLESLRTQLEKVQEYIILRKKGELLRMNIAKLHKGMNSIQLSDDDPGLGQTLKIELVKSYSPGRNIEHYFEKAKKLREKFPRIDVAVRNSEIYLDNLKRLADQLESEDSERGMLEIQGQFRDLDLLEPGISRLKKAVVPERLPYREYVTQRSEKILVGRTARDNDILTFTIAGKDDLWFHSQQTSGSHVILRRPNRDHQFQKESIIEAAELAAFHSAAKNAGTVPVIYTEIKYVHKAKKGNPGQVMADKTKSILVHPRGPKK